MHDSWPEQLAPRSLALEATSASIASLTWLSRALVVRLPAGPAVALIGSGM